MLGPDDITLDGTGTRADTIEMLPPAWPDEEITKVYKRPWYSWLRELVRR